MIRTHSLTGIRTLALGAIAVCLCTGAVAAEPAAKPTPKAAAAAAQAQYKSDLALCDSNRATESRTACRAEAARAYGEAKRGALTDATPSQYAQNARLRCDALKGIERSSCLERMNGAGKVEGSVAGGGILRENTVTVPAQ